MALHVIGPAYKITRRKLRIYPPGDSPVEMETRGPHFRVRDPMGPLLTKVNNCNNMYYSYTTSKERNYEVSTKCWNDIAKG